VSTGYRDPHYHPRSGHKVEGPRSPVPDWHIGEGIHTDPLLFPLKGIIPRPASPMAPSRRLEQQLESKLDFPRGSRRQKPGKSRALQSLIRLVEIRRVDKVENFGTELQDLTLSKTEVLV